MDLEIKKPVPINEEVVWDTTKTIMSKTDSYGTIEYVNEVFAEVSGYQEYELVGQPHSIVRHPDMPQIIFKVLWDNIKKDINFMELSKTFQNQDVIIG
ncbi:PAS domain S-box protein [Flavobacterium oreochromis]|uniref:PAS domain S-box protein n=1 Tax=Flavobacterium oreochromis TaxID=2906078 RepID=UPI0021645184|nr:PAS domain S-box protein [Flavobacterium oreochromis]